MWPQAGILRHSFFFIFYLLNMSNTRLSYRYAKALLDLAVEKSQLKEVHQDILLLNNALDNNRDFYLLMKSPIIKADKKNGILGKLFDGKISPITQGFLDIMVRKHREAYLHEIADAFLEQYNRLQKTVSARLTTAEKVGDDVIQQIKALVIQKTGMNDVELSVKTDPFLIGGFILEYEDKLMDTSIQQKLQDLELKFQENKYVRKF